jgi:hypothetical protein
MSELRYINGEEELLPPPPEAGEVDREAKLRETEGEPRGDA